MKTIYILSILIISLLSSCSVETYLSKEFTVGRNTDFVPISTEIRLQGSKCWIDGVKVANYEKSDTTLIFKCSDKEIIFKITK